MAKVLLFHYTDEGRLPKLSPEGVKKIRDAFLEELSTRDQSGYLRR